MEKKNKKMEYLLEEIKNNKKSSGCIKVDKLFELLFFKLVEIDDCVVADLGNSLEAESVDFNNVLKNYYDMTDYEASNNEIRINSYIDYEEKNNIDVLKLGLLVVENLKNRLKVEFNQYRFIIYLSVNSRGGVTLRFHKKRVDELNWLDTNDLEGFKKEAILVIET